MSAPQTTGIPTARRWNWSSYIWVVFWVGYVYIPWHYRVFFGDWLQCIFFPRDWILQAFALVGYIAIAAIAIARHRQKATARSELVIFSTCLATLFILAMLVIEYLQKCL